MSYSRQKQTFVWQMFSYLNIKQKLPVKCPKIAVEKLPINIAFGTLIVFLTPSIWPKKIRPLNGSDFVFKKCLLLFFWVPPYFYFISSCKSQSEAWLLLSLGYLEQVLLNPAGTHIFKLRSEDPRLMYWQAQTYQWRLLSKHLFSSFRAYIANCRVVFRTLPNIQEKAVLPKNAAV